MATPNSHNEWCTPPELFRVLHTEFGFQLDAAATAQNALVGHYLTDALVQAWNDGPVFCNPPYSQLPAFIRRGYEQSQDNANTVVMLIPAYTDPKYWRDYCMKAHEIRFLTGRLQFLENGKTRMSARFPSVVVIFKWFPGICYKAPHIWQWDWRAV